MMPEFRYYCLNADGKIARGRHVEVQDLAAAIRAAYEDCGSRHSPGIRVEVWQDIRCLYSTGDATPD